MEKEMLPKMALGNKWKNKDLETDQDTEGKNTLRQIEKKKRNFLEGNRNRRCGIR